MIEFDITAKPVNQEKLDDEKKYYINIYDGLQRRRTYLYGALLLLSFILIPTSIIYAHISTMYLLTMGITAIAILMPLLVLGRLNVFTITTTSTAALIVSSILVAIPAAHIQSPAMWLMFATGIALVSANLALPLLLNKAVEEQYRKIIGIIDLLQPIAPEHCPQVIEWCLLYEPVRLYQNAVAGNRRRLTEREYHAVMQWVQANPHKTDLKNACEELTKPVTIV